MRRSFAFSFLSLAAPFFLPALSQAQATPDATPLSKQVASLEERLAPDEKSLLDWPHLNRYRDAKAALRPLAKEEARVVFMGDSITDMWVQPRFGEFFPGKPYIGRGISGQTTPQMLIRFRPDVIALQPKVVVILAGTNDLAGNTGPIALQETEGNLASMSELARVNGIRVVQSSVLPVYDGGHTQEG